MTKLSPLNARDVINYARPDSYSTGRQRAATRSGTIRSLKEGDSFPTTRERTYTREPLKQ